MSLFLPIRKGMGTIFAYLFATFIGRKGDEKNKRDQDARTVKDFTFYNAETHKPETFTGTDDQWVEFKQTRPYLRTEPTDT